MDTNTRRPRRVTIFRRAGWLAVAAMVATGLFAAPGAAFAWSPPTITPLCSDVPGQYNWTVTLASGESNYNFQSSTDGTSWSSDISGVSGGNALTTSSATLFVRWSADTNSKTGPVVNTVGPCTLPKITICHAHASDTNPYNTESVDEASIENPAGHGSAGINADDIIPPFTDGSFVFPGQNWDATGQAIWNNGCKIPPPPPATYCIDISKVNGSEQALSGAVFTIKRDGSPVNVAGNPVTTNSDGNASLCGLAAGDYTVTETTPPSGYTGAADQSVTLPQTSEVRTLTFVDTLIPPPPNTYCIDISKVNGSEHGLPGAVFTIKQGSSPVDVTGNPVTTDGQGNASLCGLAAGDYTVTETTPPSGYTGAADQSVTLPQTSEVTTLTFVDTLIPPPPPPVCTVNCNPVVVLTPGLTVTKFVSLSQSGPFTGHSVTTTVGTAVWYQVTMTNSGQVALIGVTLSDSLGLPTSCSTVPTTLNVGASYSCTYSRAATVGTTTNTATGTSSQTAPKSDTATVLGTASAVEGATSNPSGAVEAATSKPHVTPPPTSALGIPAGQPAGDTWRIALLALAALLASLLVFSPKTSPERRRR